ncbi:MAG: response regulator transcription factor [Anaerolineales bacterium]|jgi:DNA-binding NarL/FixJ family response regulator|nr:response regulator transcription factor [Anaerolineales bacterium]
MKSIRVLIVDDLPSVREGLMSVLTLAGSASDPQIEIAGEARNGMHAIQQARDIQPNVILMDLEMPGLDGYAATRQIKIEQPDIRVVILSIHNDAEAQQRAQEAGADGFVTKGDRIEHLLQAILGSPDTMSSTNPTKGEKS